MSVEIIEGELYEIRRVKALFYLGYGENIVYMINLRTKKFAYKEIKSGRK